MRGERGKLLVFCVVVVPVRGARMRMRRARARWPGSEELKLGD